jgi:hypothetical protein
MSSILDALRGRPRSADRHVPPHRTGHTDVVLETLGSAKKQSTLNRVLHTGWVFFCTVAFLLLILIAWGAYNGKGVGSLFLGVL